MSGKKEFIWCKDTIAKHYVTKREDGLYDVKFIPKGKLFGELFIPAVTKQSADNLVERYTK
jgi:hypothetical protein